MSSRLWPSASRFYRAVLRWVYVPEDFSVEEDAQSAQRTVSFCFLERRAGLFLQPLFPHLFLAQLLFSFAQFLVSNNIHTRVRLACIIEGQVQTRGT